MATNELDLANRKYNTMCDTLGRRQKKLDDLLVVHDRVEAKYKELKAAGDVPKDFVDKRKAHKRKCTVARVAVKKITDEIDVHFEENPELAARYRPTEKDETATLSNDYVPELVDPAAAKEAELAEQKALLEASKPLTEEKIGTLAERASAFSLPEGLTESAPEPEAEIDPSLMIIEDDGEEDEDEDRRIAMQNAAIDAANGEDAAVVDDAKHLIPMIKRPCPKVDLKPEENLTDILPKTHAFQRPEVEHEFAEWLNATGYDLIAKGHSQHSLIHRLAAHLNVEVTSAMMNEILTDVKGIVSMIELLHRAYLTITQ